MLLQNNWVVVGTIRAGGCAAEIQQIISATVSSTDAAYMPSKSSTCPTVPAAHKQAYCPALLLQEHVPARMAVTLTHLAAAASGSPAPCYCCCCPHATAGLA
jgi:hypothetical protein